MESPALRGVGKPRSLAPPERGRLPSRSVGVSSRPCSIGISVRRWNACPAQSAARGCFAARAFPSRRSSRTSKMARRSVSFSNGFLASRRHRSKPCWNSRARAWPLPNQTDHGMNILFDQGTPAPLRDSSAGHLIATALEKAWGKLQNGDLIRVAGSEGFNALITTDQNRADPLA